MGLQIAWIGILGALSSGLGIQDEGADRRAEGGKTEPAPPERRFFERPIDFWKTGGDGSAAGAPKPAPAKSPRPAVTATPELLESIWAEPVRLPDGRFAIYLPPRAVLDFLDNPTEESLKGYLEWQRSRSEKMKKALQLLDAHRAREGEAGKPAPPVEPKDAAKDERPTAPMIKPPDSPPPPGPPFEVIYFHRKGCAPCGRQDGILSEWLPSHPEGTLKVAEFGESPELWRAHRIGGTPSLAITDAKSRKTLLLEGLADTRRLEGALGEVRGAKRPEVRADIAPAPPEKPGKENP